MPADRPQSYFLLRGSVLLIVVLALWWFFLLNPLLYLLKGPVEILGGVIFGGNSHHTVTETDSGDWKFVIRREVAVPKPPPQSGFTKEVRSITFYLARSDLNTFTFSLPVFWAIILAAPGIRHSYRPLILGTIAMTFIETALVLAFAEISALGIMAQLSGSQDEFSKWCDLFGFTVVVQVAPFIAPFLVALSLHRELRWQIFRWGNPELLPAGDARHSGQSDAENRPTSQQRRGRDTRRTRHP